METVGWYPYEVGCTIGGTGSENGLILRDEEYSACACITLERSGYTPVAITCGIYGRMVHTRFFASEKEANEAFEAMKAGLARIVDLIPSRDDPQANERPSRAGNDLHAFIEEFP
jgi:hypothetical protein